MCTPIGLGFTSDWLKKWREKFEPNTEWSNHKPKQFGNYFRHSIENRSVAHDNVPRQSNQPVKTQNRFIQSALYVAKKQTNKTKQNRSELPGLTIKWYVSSFIYRVCILSPHSLYLQEWTIRRIFVVAEKRENCHMHLVKGHHSRQSPTQCHCITFQIFVSVDVTYEPLQSNWFHDTLI